MSEGTESYASDFESFGSYDVDDFEDYTSTDLEEDNQSTTEVLKEDSTAQTDEEQSKTIEYMMKQLKKQPTRNIPNIQLQQKETIHCITTKKSNHLKQMVVEDLPRRISIIIKCTKILNYDKNIHTSTNSFKKIYDAHTTPKDNSIPLHVYNKVKIQALHSSATRDITVEGIFSEREKTRQQQKELSRLTSHYINRHTEQLKAKNILRDHQQLQQEDLDAKYNPILMIGQILEDCPQSIEEQIDRKRGIEKQRDTQKKHRTVQDNVERLENIVANTRKSEICSSKVRWEAMMAVTK